jgi:hypothetical protein
MSPANDYYVYVYIDPRNYEEFYYGKGKGSRKDAHLTDPSDSEKVRRIGAIQKAGLEPIVRVITRDLSEHDALLVEKTLLWKLGRQLTNISSGHSRRISALTARFIRCFLASITNVDFTSSPRAAFAWFLVAVSY